MLCCAVLYTVFIYLIMIVLFWEYVQSMWIMCLLICLYYMLFHCSGSVCLYMNKFHWWDLLSYILNRIFQFLSLSLSLRGGGGNSPPYAKNEGGGGNCPLLSVQKDGRGNVHPLLYCRRGNALTLPKIGGGGGIVLPTWFEQGGKCPGGEMSGYRKIMYTPVNPSFTV